MIKFSKLVILVTIITLGIYAGYFLATPLDELKTVESDTSRVTESVRSNLEVVRTPAVSRGYINRNSEMIIFESRVDKIYSLGESNIRLNTSLNSPILRKSKANEVFDRVGISLEWSKISIEGQEYFIHNSVIDKLSNKYAREIDSLARIINAEARNQSEEGRKAVGSVIMNRLRLKYASTLEGVIAAPNQFHGYKSNLWYSDYSESTKSIAEAVYHGDTNLPLEVTNFKTNTCSVNWSNELYTTIGDHNFYYK